MVWTVKVDEKALKDLKKIDNQNAKRIVEFLHKHVPSLENPRQNGMALKRSDLSEFWRYRVGKYRIIVRIEDDIMQVIAVRIGLREKIYKKP